MSQVITLTETAEVTDFSFLNVWDDENEPVLQVLEERPPVDEKESAHDLKPLSQHDLEDASEMVEDCLIQVRQIIDMCNEADCLHEESKSLEPKATREKLEQILPILVTLEHQFRTNSCQLSRLFLKFGRHIFCVLSKIKELLAKEKRSGVVSPDTSKWVDIFISCVTTVEMVLIIAENHSKVVGLQNDVFQWSTDYKQKLTEAETKCHEAFNNLTAFFAEKSADTVSPNEFTKLFEFRQRQHRLIQTLNWYRQTIGAGEKALERLEKHVEALTKDSRQVFNLSLGGVLATVGTGLIGAFNGNQAAVVGCFVSSILTICAAATAAETLEMLRDVHEQMKSNWQLLDHHKQTYSQIVADTKAFCDSRFENALLKKEALMKEQEAFMKEKEARRNAEYVQREEEMKKREEEIKRKEREMHRRMEELAAMQAAMKRVETE